MTIRRVLVAQIMAKYKRVAAVPYKQLCKQLCIEKVKSGTPLPWLAAWPVNTAQTFFPESLVSLAQMAEPVATLTMHKGPSGKAEKEQPPPESTPSSMADLFRQFDDPSWSQIINGLFTELVSGYCYMSLRHPVLIPWTCL